MVESKKETKQATLNAFFSPKKLGQESYEKAVESELKSVGAKRPRASLPAADKHEAIKTPAKKKETPKPLVKTKRKTKASKKQKKPIRFMSPHVLAADDEEDDDLNDERDVFNTPEAKKARAELETGGEIVPPGALISDDAVVNEDEVVDVSEEDATTKSDIVRNDTTTGVVNLSRASGSGTDTGKIVINHNESKTTAKAPARHHKTPAKSTIKRQQKTPEKTTAESPPAQAEPLDPLIQARVDAYKIKTDELTKAYTDLLVSNDEKDVILQDIYGAKLDCDLDVTVDDLKALQALAETWQKLEHHAQSICTTTDAVMVSTSVEFPHEVKCLIVKGIQGRSASLSVMSGELLAAFKKDLEAIHMEKKTENGQKADMIDRAASLAMEMEIKMLAQRTPHGVRPAKANVFEDTTMDALWVWEVGSLEQFFGEEAQKIVKRMRKHRKRLGQQLKTLAKVVQLLHQNPVDEAKVSAEEAKIGKFGLVVAAEVQKAKDREAKVQEKRNAAEEKLRLEQERQEAKMEEKRKRDREVEEKKLESFKAQKKFKSFFASAQAAADTGGSDSIVDLTDREHTRIKAADSVESSSAKSARMDQTLSFLVSDKDVSSSEAFPGGSYESIFSSMKSKRGSETSLIGWTSRRHRDPKFGVMKLLQFYENNRPAYYGTFRTQCRLFRGGRRPFSKFPKFDYSVDSDDEWEEEEPGESLSDDENDGDESEEDNLDYNDQWLAYEDEVDYMDDAEKEGDRGDLDQLSPTKHKLPSQLQKKAKAVKPAKLEPQIIGPFWCGSVCSDNHFPGCTGELLCAPMFESNLMRKAREREEELKKLEALRQQKEAQVEQKMAQTQETNAPDQENDRNELEGGQETAAAEKTTKAGPRKGLQQKATPKKGKNPKVPAVAKSTPASSTPSPAKGTKRIISWFKKVSDSVSKSQETPSESVDAQRPKEKEIITIDD